MCQIAEGLIPTDSPDPNGARKQLIDLTSAGRGTLEQSRLQRSDWLAQQLKEKISAPELEMLASAVKLVEQLAAPDQGT